MRIVQSPMIQLHMVEVHEYSPAAPLTRCLNRIDRMLGGNPKPPQPVYIKRIPGRINWSNGFLQLENGESIDIGEKIKEPIIDNMTGNKLFGVFPFFREGTIVEFTVDYVEEWKKVEPIL